MKAKPFEFSPEEFADTTPLTPAELTRIGFPNPHEFTESKKDMSMRLSTGTLAVTNMSSRTGAWCQFKDEDGHVIDVLPHQVTVGDMKFLIWRLERPDSGGASVDAFLASAKRG